MMDNLEKSQVLIDALAEFNLQMVLPKDVPTLQALATGNHTRLDNIFISSKLVGSIIRCAMLPDERLARSDHIPVVTEVNTQLEEWMAPLHPNFRLVDWKEVRERLSNRLEVLSEKVCLSVEELLGQSCTKQQWL